MLKIAILASFLAAACTTTSSTAGQAITCDTDPATGEVTSCAPSDGSPLGPNQCSDIDEDGDGRPGDHHDDDDADEAEDETEDETPDDDSARVVTTKAEGDSDEDGVDDDHDCDHHEGEDEDEDEAEDETGEDL